VWFDPHFSPNLDLDPRFSRFFLFNLWSRHIYPNLVVLRLLQASPSSTYVDVHSFIAETYVLVHFAGTYSWIARNRTVWRRRRLKLKRIGIARKGFFFLLETGQYGEGRTEADEEAHRNY
jgi:hypothetical protein